MRHFAHTLVLAVVFAMAASDDAAAQGAPDTAFAVVHLRQTGSTCGVIHKTDRVRLSKSTRRNVEFVVVNDCASPVTISFSDFRHDATPSAADPLETAVADRARNIPANQVVTAFRLRVGTNATVGTWSYNVRLGGVIVDPKLDIDP